MSLARKVFWAAFFLLSGASSPLLHAAEPEKSVVQIICFSQRPLWNEPWRFDVVRKASGSGFLISGNLILTNAHVVSWAKQIIVQRYQDPRNYIAHVKFIGHDCDLAALEVNDPAFYEGMKPLDFGELPKVRSTVTTCGYPAGGEQISYTRGVVSRIEVETYSHIQNRSFLVVQTDAAINPGNSGGPVLQEDKVVGVAFQGANGLENTGYFIPTSVIHHFLVDIEDGQYDGFPDAGILFAALENQAYRKRLALPDNGLGSRVDGFLPVPSTQRVLQLDDVILKIGSYPVASDSTVLYEGNRVDLGVIFDGVQNGESVDLKIWRNGQEENVSLPLFIYRKDRAEGAQYDRLPRYYIWGGMVFVALSADYLNTVGNDFTAAADLLYELGFHGYEKPSERREEPVVLASTLAHTVNADIQVRNRALVDKVNGVRIEKLEDLAKAFEGSTNEFDVIEFGSQSRFECMDHKAAEAANADILKSYRIPAKSRL